MRKAKIVLNHPGITELLSSEQMAQGLKPYAEHILVNAGEGFELSRGYSEIGGGRVAWRVCPDSYAAKLAEAEDKTLSRAVHS